MKEIISANIAGISFNFDNDAYELLEDYFSALRRAYEGQNDGPEIVADITSRIAELILEEQPAEAIVSKPMIKKIIEQTGLPDEAPVADNVKYEIPRRLYRNPEGRRMAGVCSGLGSYFNTDPLIFRIIFLLPLMLSVVDMAFWDRMHLHLTKGFSIIYLLYFVMWAVVPMAKTPRQKLEMQGERITVDSIKRRFDYDYAEASPQSSQTGSLLARFLGFILQIFIIFAKIIAIIVGFAFAVTAVALLVAFFCLLFNINGVVVMEGVRLPELVGVSPQIYALLIIAMIMIPVILITSALISLLFKARYSKMAATILIGLWVLVASFTAIITARNFHTLRHWNNFEYSDRGESMQRYIIPIEGVDSGEAGEVSDDAGDRVEEAVPEE